MATQIINNGATIKLTISGSTRFIPKPSIVGITIAKTGIIKIDIGKGIANIFLTYSDITLPTSSNIIELVEQLNEMLPQSAVVGGATEAKQDTTNSTLLLIRTDLDAVITRLEALNNKLYFDALLVDESGVNTIYRGFALPGSSTSAAVWAIERTTISGDITVKKWAGGTKTFGFIWDNRESLTYS